MGNKNVSKYQDINKELTQHQIEWILGFLTEKFGEGFSAKSARYDEVEGLFYADFGEPFVNERVLKDKEMDIIYQKLYQAMIKEEREQFWLDNYGRAVNYFYNDVYIDENGFYRKKNLLSKKVYFTRYELDELNKRYEDIKSES